MFSICKREQEHLESQNTLDELNLTSVYLHQQAKDKNYGGVYVYKTNHLKRIGQREKRR